MIKILFAAVDLSKDEFLFFPRINFSNWDTPMLNGVKTDMFLPDIAQQGRQKIQMLSTFTSLYSNLPDQLQFEEEGFFSFKT